MLTAMPRLSLNLIALVIFSLLSTTASAITYDFEDGTMQGWTAGNADGQGFNGTLGLISIGGNPGFYLRATDTVPGGGCLCTEAPSVLSGDFSAIPSITWDQLIPGGSTVSTSVLLRGSDGTLWISENSPTSSGVWTSRTANFNNPSEWSLLLGTASFASVLSNVDALFISLDTVNGVGTEAGIDNVNVVPEPSTALLMGLGLVGLGAAGKRK